MSELKTRITEDMKAALKGGDKQRLAAIRLILAAMKQVEVDERVTLDDARIVHIMDKMLKQRRDSITQYEAARREDLAQQERYELELIEAYMPAQVSAAEVDAIVDAAVRDTGATSMRDMGKVMAQVRERAAGRADMGELSQRVKARLASG